MAGAIFCCFLASGPKTKHSQYGWEILVLLPNSLHHHPKLWPHAVLTASSKQTTNFSATHSPQYGPVQTNRREQLTN